MLMAPVISRLLESRPCIQAIGPKPNKLMILGEAPGAEEEKFGIPFVGSAGKELDRMCREIDFPLASAYKTNVFWTRPINNKLETIFLPQADWKAQNSSLVPSLPFRIDNKTHYLPPAFQSELTRLREEIEAVNPNLIIALGATALWSLTGRQNISSVRGTVLQSSVSSTSIGRKVLPTFHPAAVLRQWDLRTIVQADLLKAKRQMEFPEVRRPARQILTDPTLQDLRAASFAFQQANILAVDVETRLGQITEIGFASSPQFAVVVPFIKGFNENYWKTAAEEIEALRIVKAILQSPVPKVFQNGLYDIQYIWRSWRFPPRNCAHDTMLKHHALFPELQKGLGFMGSIYTEEPAWKLMRLKKETEGKSDDE